MRKSLVLATACALGIAVACSGSTSSSDGSSGGDADGGPGTTGGADSGVSGGNDGHDGGANGTDSGGNGGADGGNPGDAGGGSKLQSIKTVFVIMMENHSWSTLKTSSSATYINKTLATLGGHAEAYSTPKGNHPSEPNYIWLESGGNLGITTDNPPSANHQSTKSHLVDQLETAGLTWKAYAEGIDGKSCPLTDTGLFLVRHTPMLFFDDVTDTNSKTAARCIAHVRPYTELATDLAGTTANYNFITPDLCDDMHGEVTGSDCNTLTGADLVKLGDAWLAANVPQILASSAYKESGALFVLWDEGDEPALQTASDGPLPAFILSPFAKVNHGNSIPYTHSSTLRTVEEIFGLPLLGDAANATDLSDFFE